MTYIALPVVLFLGWVIYVSWLLGIEGRWILILILISIFYFSIDFIKKSKVRQEDIRWLVAPFLIWPTALGIDLEATLVWRRLSAFQQSHAGLRPLETHNKRKPKTPKLPQRPAPPTPDECASCVWQLARWPARSLAPAGSAPALNCAGNVAAPPAGHRATAVPRCAHVPANRLLPAAAPAAYAGLLGWPAASP